MQRIILFFCFSFISYFSFSQFSVGQDQTICLGETSQVIASISGPGMSNCTGISDSLVTQLAGGNGSSGTTFNLINTSGSPLDITGISQGGTYTLTNELMEVWMYPGDIYTTPLPIGSPPYPGWIMVGSAIINTTGGLSLGYIPISGVTVPVAATYTFRVQTQSITVSYTNGTGTAGVTPWASDNNIIITEGHGGSSTNWFSFTPRCFNGAIHYGGGASWYDANTGLGIGSGDTLLYLPTQTTDVYALLGCNGQIYSDTMHIDVLNTSISSTGQSLCNGPVILSVSSNFSSYNWNVLG
ncbi:MAG: hypothetical protein VX370_04055, partial [Bacteroidota bacterium]|nr:hypothetical protein [Bacteroidota bacterium]